MPHRSKNSVEPSHFSPDTLEFIRLLSVHGVHYVVVGGEAVIYHGYPRFTGDIDFFYSDSPANSDALFVALQAFWSGNIPGIQTAEELAEPGVIIQFGRPPNRIDLLNRIDAVSFHEAWNSKIELRIAGAEPGIPLFMVSLDNLLRNKRASGRPKDLDDLRVLEGLR
jgi:hypothetical protein